jgi:hypothetical protein
MDSGGFLGCSGQGVAGGPLGNAPRRPGRRCRIERAGGTQPRVDLASILKRPENGADAPVLALAWPMSDPRAVKELTESVRRAA